jgi:hypothetical protein
LRYVAVLLTVLIDAAVLIGLLKGITDADVGLGLAVVLAIGTSIGVTALAYVLIPVMGIWGLIIAANVGGLVLGVLISALFGTEIKRSFFVGGIFVLVHIVVVICLSAATRV